LFRQPLGVVAAITPFNFPGMIPLWFLPYAIACGNCFILKPSERVPMTSVRLFELLHETGLPKGVAQLVHGDKRAVDALLDHPGIQAVSFVGSTPIAKYVYRRAAASGKRAQCNGGAKNAVVIMPDADVDTTSKIVAESAFGCAGQRCLAASVAIAVGDAFPVFSEALADAAASRRVGYGLDDGVLMGPVISDRSKARVENLIEQGVAEGAEVLVDGRGKKVTGYQGGHFVAPTLLRGGRPSAEAVDTEFFGPVLSLFRATSLREAIEQVNSSAFGNMASLFTQNGSAARQFRYEAKAGNVGINIGVAAPMAPFPFSGWKESFFGDLHPQGRHAIEFYTQTKVVIERWPQRA
jgi:malonate-semialdehyde dehydrogenase (acetylating)/methylmalonate-semialdehyde dehydrogenase